MCHWMCIANPSLLSSFLSVGPKLFNQSTDDEVGTSKYAFDHDSKIKNVTTKIRIIRKVEVPRQI